MAKTKKSPEQDHSRSFESVLLQMDSPLWGAFIPVSTDIAHHFKKAGITRFVCTINQQLTIHSAIMPGGNDTFFLLMNKANVKALKIAIGSTVSVQLTEDTSQYGMPLCEEMSSLLEEDPDFKKHFENLTPGKQRNLIYIINKAKSSEIRLRTAVVVADHLLANSGVLDFKMLNEALKQK